MDEARCIVVENPGIFLSMWVHRQLFEVIYGLLKQTKFEHQNTVIEATDEMVWIDEQTSL